MDELSESFISGLTNIDDRIIILQTNDNVEFLVPKDIGFMCGKIKSLYISHDKIIHIGIDSNIMTRIIEFCKFHSWRLCDPTFPFNYDEIITPWDKEFCSDMEPHIILKMIAAANYLDLKPLINIICKYLAVIGYDAIVKNRQGKNNSI